MARHPNQDANMAPPFDSNQSREEAAKNGRLGGIKSGESRRKKRDARQAAQRLLSMDAKGRMRENLVELGYDKVDDDDGIQNIDVLVARLLVQAASGNLNASKQLLQIAGYEPEEIRAERESVNADKRRERESIARLEAIEAGVLGRHSTSVTDGDDGEGVEDVFVYLPDNGRDKHLQTQAPAREEEDTELTNEDAELQEGQ